MKNVAIIILGVLTVIFGFNYYILVKAVTGHIMPHTDWKYYNCGEWDYDCLKYLFNDAAEYYRKGHKMYDHFYKCKMKQIGKG